MKFTACFHFITLALLMLLVAPAGSADDDIDFGPFAQRVEPGSVDPNADPNVLAVGRAGSTVVTSTDTTSTDTTSTTGTDQGPTPPSGPVTVPVPVSPGSSTTTPYTFYPGGLPPATSDNPSLETSGEIWRAFARGQITREDYIKRMRELQEKDRRGSRPAVDTKDDQEADVEDETEEEDDNDD